MDLLLSFEPALFSGATWDGAPLGPEELDAVLKYPERAQIPMSGTA